MASDDSGAPAALASSDTTDAAAHTQESGEDADAGAEAPGAEAETAIDENAAGQSAAAEGVDTSAGDPAAAAEATAAEAAAAPPLVFPGVSAPMLGPGVTHFSQGAQTVPHALTPPMSEFVERSHQFIDWNIVTLKRILHLLDRPPIIINPGGPAGPPPPMPVIPSPSSSAILGCSSFFF